jgi:mxaD protein
MRRTVLCPSVAVLVLSVVGGEARAGDLSVKKTLSLPGSPDATWSLIADYCAIEKWHPAIAKCQIAAGTANRPGAVRVLTLRDGASVREELTSHDVKKRSFSYKILEGPLPVESYAATMTVLPGPGGGSVLEWSSTFKAAPGAEDAAARSVVEGIYDAGLAGLKTMATAK